MVEFTRSELIYIFGHGGKSKDVRKNLTSRLKENTVSFITRNKQAV
jgi:hypothetical protein